MPLQRAQLAGWLGRDCKGFNTEYTAAELIVIVENAWARGSVESSDDYVAEPCTVGITARTY